MFNFIYKMTAITASNFYHTLNMQIPLFSLNDWDNFQNNFSTLNIRKHACSHLKRVNPLHAHFSQGFFAKKFRSLLLINNRAVSSIFFVLLHRTDKYAKCV